MLDERTASATLQQQLGLGSLAWSNQAFDYAKMHWVWVQGIEL